ncbi:acetate kinase [Dyella tabacisoli]|uniref:Acetate kinase n=1 Tax=Dyella tabacisoli TaxID=2282381 RepID=A0A369UUU1_9GAMM|nr:acetate kinase [Dyella tabacisoli]RDD83498.1 acetate kinase [Dyella tabacisoli]
MRLCSLGCASLVLVSGAMNAQQAPAPDNSSEVSAQIKQKVVEQGQRLDAMRSRLANQLEEIDAMKRTLAQQEAEYQTLRHAVGMDVLDQQRGGNANAAGARASALPMPGSDLLAAADTTVKPPQPVGQAPQHDERPPEVAPIFDQPGVLTPRGKLVVEPSYQFGYSSADRVALIGYTVIPAILIGLIDARQVKTTTQTAAVAARYGITNRLEVELRVPYVYGHTDTISREIFTGSAQDKVFGSSGHGIGDVEATARYQLNNGGADKPYYIAWLRFKSRTGRDPFEVVTDCVNRCVQNATGTGLPLQLPTGSGFYSIQPGVTWLYPSDPVVFFGNLSYLHNFARSNVSRNLVLAGKEFLGKVQVGDVVDVSVGMGLALNDKASFSIGYDQSFVGLTKQNGKTVAGSAKSVLGTLLIGGSYRFNEKRTVNFTLGVGVTRDTPDATVTVRVPMMY